MIAFEPLSTRETILLADRRLRKTSTLPDLEHGVVADALRAEATIRGLLQPVAL